MKTKEELNELKEEVEAVNEKLQELTPEEIAQVNGGASTIACNNSFVKRDPLGGCMDFNKGRCPCPDTPCFFRL